MKGVARLYCKRENLEEEEGGKNWALTKSRRRSAGILWGGTSGHSEKLKEKGEDKTHPSRASKLRRTEAKEEGGNRNP